jgi:AmmeMemoRadiSam system protein A
MNSSHLLTKDEKEFLLDLAREVITCTAEGRDFSTPSFYSDTLKKEQGVFVTLHKDGELRGCIGYVEAVYPLQTAVEKMALSAAFNDPRFPPLSKEETDLMDIEISVLSPLQAIKNIEEIEIGKHGLIIEQDYYKGLLLPQVAVEYNWDCKTFLQHACQKAGLPENAWKDRNTKIQIFSAEIFSEQD